MLMITLYAEQKKRHRFIEQSFRLCESFFKVFQEHQLFDSTFNKWEHNKNFLTSSPLSNQLLNLLDSVANKSFIQPISFLSVPVLF